MGSHGAGATTSTTIYFRVRAPFALAQDLRKPTDAVTIGRVHDSTLSSGSRSAVMPARPPFGNRWLPINNERSVGYNR